MTTFEVGTAYETEGDDTLKTFVCRVFFIKDNKASVAVGRTGKQLILPITVRDGIERMDSPHGEFSANRPW